MTNVAVRESDLEKRTTDELIHLVHKFRWMGLEEEAMKAQLQLAHRTDLSGGDRFLELGRNSQKGSTKNILSIDGIRRAHGNTTGCARTRSRQ
jgi:hypothetical protein